jgi:DUF1365 family protein
MTASALYTGLVSHRRTRPAVHALRYRVFMMLLDLDEAPALNRRLRLFRFDRRGVLSFHQRDHGDGTKGGLRGWVETQLQAAGMPTGGAIGVFCMPRVFGYAFNPLTVFFCHGLDGKLLATIYEVNNTFGQRHAYVLPAGGRQDLVAQECEKAFHVSPFMDMDLRYRFRIIPPHEEVSIGIQVLDAHGIILAASFSGDRQPLTDRAMLREILAMPLQGAKVLGGIHWEAAKLWLKGVKLRPAPPLPARPVSIPLSPTTTTVTP